MRRPHHRGYWHTPPSNAAAERGEDSWPGSLRSRAIFVVEEPGVAVSPGTQGMNGLLSAARHGNPT